MAKRFRISPKILSALEILAEASLGTADFITAFLNAGYGASYSKLGYEIDKIERMRERRKIDSQKKQALYQLLTNLKKDDLIKKKDDKWFLTEQGLDKLKILKERYIPIKFYKKAEDEDFKIVSFDIPESQRTKRDWLRISLSNLGFKMLQKSVWIGKVKVPEDFIQCLHQFNLVNYVEIFSVNKQGTLRNLT